jgi:hypothetical protein
MNKLPWWRVSGAETPWAVCISARVSCTHPTAEQACRRPPANFIAGGQLPARNCRRTDKTKIPEPQQGFVRAEGASAEPAPTAIRCNPPAPASIDMNPVDRWVAH